MIRIPVMVGKKEYIIKTDAYNYMIGTEYEVEKGNRKGEKVFKPDSCYSSLSGCMNRLLDMKIKHSTVKTLEGLRRVIERSRKEVIEIYDTHMEK